MNGLDNIGNIAFVVSNIIILLLNYITNKDYLRPSILYGCGFVVSGLFLVFSYGTWKYTLSLTTIILITLSHVILYFGEGTALRIMIGSTRKRTVSTHDMPGALLTGQQINVRRKVFIVVSVVIALVLAVLRVTTIRMSNELYGVGDYYLSSYRAYGVSELSDNILIKVTELVSSAFAYYYLYVFFISGKKKKAYLIPILLCFISDVLSSSRSGIIYRIFVCTLLWVCVNRIKRKSVRLTKHEKRRIVAILFVGLVIFALVGYLTGKTQRGGFFDSISVYTAGSLPALDIFMKGYDGSHEFGFYTFESIKRIMEIIGIKITYNLSYYSHGTFTTWGSNLSTNVYTCLRAYLLDYGYIGTMILFYILGIVYGGLYKHTMRNNTNPCKQVIYSMLVFYLFFSFITERVFSQTLTVTTILAVILTRLLFHYMPVYETLNYQKQGL